MNLIDMAGATFSDDRLYRYTLWRRWAEGGQTVNGLFLNPSTADETTNDRTIAKFQNWARRQGFSALIITNIFALRSPYPTDLRKAHKKGVDPVGPGNDAAIIQTVRESNLVIAGWGNNGLFLKRGQAVCELVTSCSSATEIAAKICAFRMTKRGQPEHPLYLKLADLPLKNYWTFQGMGN